MNYQFGDIDCVIKNQADFNAIFYKILLQVLNLFTPHSK